MAYRSRQRKHGGGKFKSERLASADSCGRRCPEPRRSGRIIAVLGSRIGRVGDRSAGGVAKTCPQRKRDFCPLPRRDAKENQAAMADDPNTPPPAGATPPPPPAPPNPPDVPLGEAGWRALEAERTARKEAEKRAAAAERKAQEADRKVQGIIQQSNLVDSLAQAGIAGPKAKAAMKLLDGIEFDENGQPTNLTERLDAAKAEYGPELFAAGATPPAPTGATPPPGTPPGAPPADPHQGPRRDAAPTEDEQFAQYMRDNFPQFTPAGGQS